MEIANKFELHYFLDDDSHLIDAFVRHKCEAEVLTIIKDVITSFGYEIEIMTEPTAEGGFREFWTFLGKSNNQLALILAIVVAVMSRIPVSNSELEKIQIENLQLDNELKRVQLQQLKKELNETKGNDSNVIDKTILYFDSNYKIIKHKSNFYQTLMGYNKVVKISTTAYRDNTPVGIYHEVNSADFSKFILSTDTLPSVINTNAVIEIVAPVIKMGKYRWKGIYNGEIIDFIMLDEDYKTDIDQRKITFQSGVYIECILEINRKIDEVGIVKNSGYFVKKVLERTIEDQSIINAEKEKRKNYLSSLNK